MFNQYDKLNSCFYRFEQFLLKALMLLADVTAQLLQVLFSVDDEPGIIQAHIITDKKLAREMFYSELIKCLYNLPDCPRFFTGINLYIQQYPS